MGRKYAKAVNSVNAAIIASVIATALTGCTNLKYEKEETFKSPSGGEKVIVKVDYVSSPDVWYDGECVFEYEGSGFTEDVFWDIEWVSEDEVVLYIESPIRDKYANERYTIKLPQ